MAHAVEWTESAVASLIDAIQYIARDSPSYAAAFAVRAEHAAASLHHFLTVAAASPSSTTLRSQSYRSPAIV